MIDWGDPRIIGAAILGSVTVAGLIFAKYVEYKVSNRRDSIKALITKTYAKFKQLLLLSYFNKMQYFPTKRLRSDLGTIQFFQKFIALKNSEHSKDDIKPFIKTKKDRERLITLFDIPVSLEDKPESIDLDTLATLLHQLDLTAYKNTIPLAHFPRITLDKISQMDDKETVNAFTDLTSLVEAYNEQLSIFEKRLQKSLVDPERNNEFFGQAKAYPSKTSCYAIFGLSFAKTRDLLGLPKSLEAKDCSQQMLYEEISNPDFLASIAEIKHDQDRLNVYLNSVKEVDNWGDQLKTLKFKKLKTKTSHENGFEDMIFNSSNNTEIRRKGFDSVANDLFSTEEFVNFVRKEPFYKALSWWDRTNIRIKKLLSEML